MARVYKKRVAKTATLGRGTLVPRPASSVTASLPTYDKKALARVTDPTMPDFGFADMATPPLKRTMK